MSFLYKSTQTNSKIKEAAIAKILDNATPDKEYYAMLIGSILLALGAIFTDSIPTLIASMIVAPLAYPILALGLGIASGNGKLIARASSLLLFSCALALAIGMTAAILFNKDRVPDILISFSSNDYIAVGVAVVSGCIAAFAATRPKVATVLLGIAIAVSLMPPLVASGVNMAPGGSPLQGAPRLFVLNVLGILISSSLVFVCTGLAKTYRTMRP